MKLDMVTGITETHSTRPAPTFTSNIRQCHDDDTDDDGVAIRRNHEERILNAIETIPQRITSTTTNMGIPQTRPFQIRPTTLRRYF